MTSQEVTFTSDGHQLAGTFEQAGAPVAAALLIPGSGKTDRNSDVRLLPGMTLRAGITRAVAESLSTVHVSSLRYDKRGVGASSGDSLRVGMKERLADARAALRWLAARCPGLPLLVVGHSEGTFYAAQLAGQDASDDPGVSGIVLLSGSARPGGEVLAWQAQQLADKLPAAARLVLWLMRTDVVKAQRKNLDKILASKGDVVRVQGSKVNARWVRDFARYDPSVALAGLTVPVLAITGGHDLQVPPDDVKAMEHLVRGPFEGHVVAGLSHLLRPDPASLGPRGYRRSVRAPVSPEVLDLITAWVAANWDHGNGSNDE
jgi:uncharacterized protein